MAEDDAASMIAALEAERDALTAELLGAQAELEAFSEQVRQLEPVLRAERDALVHELDEAHRQLALLRAEPGAETAPGSSSLGSGAAVQVFQLRRELAVAQAELAAAAAERDSALAERDAAYAERDATERLGPPGAGHSRLSEAPPSSESPRFAAAALAHLSAENEVLRTELVALRKVAAASRSAPTSTGLGDSVEALRAALASAELRAATAEAAAATYAAQCADRDELDAALSSALQLVRELSATCEQVPGMKAQLESFRRGEASAQRQLAAAQADLQAVAALTPALEALRTEHDAAASACAAAEAARDKAQRELRDAEAQLVALQACLQQEAGTTRAVRRQQADMEAAWKREKQSLVDMHAEQLAAAARDAVALKVLLRQAVDGVQKQATAHS
jgi:hypothetical protein